MSHTVTVTMIADSEILIDGEAIDVLHDLKIIVVDSNGKITEAHLKRKEPLSQTQAVAILQKHFGRDWEDLIRALASVNVS